MAYGNTSTSSLISSIQSAKAKLNTANDTYNQLNYENSAQTADDYNQYRSYLDNRATNETDPTKKMELQQKVNTAYSGYVGNEVQRQSMAVIEGSGSNTQKYNTLYKLYQQAPTDAIRQNIASQLDSLSRTIQDEATASASKALATSKKGINKALSQQTLALKAVQAAAGTGKPMTDDDGTPIVLDPNAPGGLRAANPGEQGSVITARQAAIVKALNYQNKETIYKQAIASGLDDTGSLQNDLLTMQSSPEYRKSTNPELIGALQNGANPFTNKVIDGYGDMSVENRTQTGVGANGQPTYSTGFLGDNSKLASTNPIDISYDRKAGTSPSAPMDNYTTPSFALDPTATDPATGAPIAAYNRNLQDPITGKTLYAGTTPVRTAPNGKGGILTPGIPGTLPQTAADANAGRKVGLAQDLEAIDFNPMHGLSTLVQHPAQALGNYANALTLGGVSHIVNPVAGVIGHILHPAPGIQVMPHPAIPKATAPGTIAPGARPLNMPQVLAPKPAAKIIAPPKMLQKPVAAAAPAPTLHTMLPQVLAKSAPAPAPVAHAVWYNPLSWFK